MSNRAFESFSLAAQQLSRNPLGIIALFIVLVYGFACVLVATGGKNPDPSERLPLIWFLVLFPVLVLGAFYRLVTPHHRKLYAPSDYRDESLFLASLSEERVQALGQILDDVDEALLRIAQVAAKGGRVADQGPIQRVQELGEQGVIPKEFAEQLADFLASSREALTRSGIPIGLSEYLIINGASLVSKLRRLCKTLEMEREFDAHGLWHMRELRPKEVQRYSSWSAVAASAPDLDYDYDIYREAAERHNNRLIDSMGDQQAAKGLIDILDMEEYVKVLQFRESEIQRVLAAYEKGQEAFAEANNAWQWPIEWGDVGWNGPVVNGWLRDVELELARTRKALQKYCQRMRTGA